MCEGSLETEDKVETIICSGIIAQQYRKGTGSSINKAILPVLDLGEPLVVLVMRW